MKPQKDTAIVLSRIDYGEKDRILTLLCAEVGKISVLSKGVRAQKSRLAGGIELLSESEVTFLNGRGSLKTLTGARLSHHFENLVSDYARMNQAFSYIKALNKICEDGGGQEYYSLLRTALVHLNNDSFSAAIVDIWFNLHILSVSGSAPNLQLFSSSETFNFDFEDQIFVEHSAGSFTQQDIKLLRLCIVSTSPPRLQAVLSSEEQLKALTQRLLRTNVTEL